MQKYKTNAQRSISRKTDESDDYFLKMLEIQRNQIFRVLDALTDFNSAFENEQLLEIFKSIKTLNELLDSNKEVLPQFIPEENVKQLIKILANVQEESIRQCTLQLFSVLISLSDNTNDNMSILIKNSFLEVILNFHEIIKSQEYIIAKDQSKRKTKQLYLELIFSLIKFCINNSPSKASDIIMQKINYNFITSLFESVNYCITKKWLKCVQNFFIYHQNLHIPIDFQIF